MTERSPDIFSSFRTKEANLNPVRSQEGLTLIELLVVSVLLALMAGILYGTITGILRGTAVVQEQREVTRTAQYVLERMSRELTGRALYPLSEQKSNGQSSAGAAGSRRSYFEGKNKKKRSIENDSIRFISSNAAQALYSAEGNFGLVEITYFLSEPDDDRFKGTSSDSLTNHLLIRREIPADVKNDKILKKKAFENPIAENIVGLNFRYFSEDQWLDEWIGKQARLPEAIEISLRIQGAEGQVETFRTAVAISKPKKRRR